MPSEEPVRILLVEDDAGLRELIREELEDAGYAVVEAADVPAARELLRTQAPGLVVSDLRLPGENGLALLASARQQALPPGFIMITAFGTVEQAVEALKQGADDFLTKPLQLDHLRLSVARTLERRALREELSRYRSMLGSGDFHGLLGRSPAMRELFEQIRRIARASGPVLVLGESGVGKELVARALHDESERRDGPFVAMNCAGIPAELLESELFGHSAGAFTGAQRARKGLFAEAEGGTLLLDEVGEMPVEMQSKLLRILQDGRMRPVGENRERQVDVRIVAATNRDLEAGIAAGGFRADLFYRLETFALRVPPLREREDDIDLLAAHFVARFAGASASPVRGITLEAVECLRAYGFPGNVRELSNAIERAVAFCRGSEIGVEDLPTRIREGARRQGVVVPDLPGDGPPALVPPGQLPPLREVEQRYVRHVLERLDNNKRRAAQVLGIGRRTLYRYLEEEAG
ncbi:MAG: sigma-54 dependent transcriptional regulator [Gammaproteobacteria bacterium]|nr:sigma-54 dependent transcriptional regulator [Gammaproteobacteria bacterium]